MSKQFIRLLVMLLGITLLDFIFFELAQSSNTLIPVSPLEYLSSYQQFLFQMFQGDFGTIHPSNEAILQQFFIKLPASLELIIPSILIAWLVGVPLAVMAVKKPLGWVDRIVQFLGSLIYSLPVFWWGLILLIIFSTGLEWFPVGGRLDYIYDIQTQTGSALIDTLLSTQSYANEAFFDALSRTFLPILTLAMLPTAYITLQIRSHLEETLQYDYMKSAKARGMSHSRIIWLHGLPNAIQPVLNSMSLQFSMLITSTIIVEFIYSWPGLGHWFLVLVQRQDYLALRGALMLIASAILLANTVTDILKYWSNPRLQR